MICGANIRILIMRITISMCWSVLTSSWENATDDYADVQADLSPLAHILARVRRGLFRQTHHQSKRRSSDGRNVEKTGGINSGPADFAYERGFGDHEKNDL